MWIWWGFHSFLSGVSWDSAARKNALSQRQCCWKECFVTDEANNPPGVSKNILALEFPEQITLGKWQHLCVRLVDLQGDENWNSNFCVFSFPLPLGPHPSYPIAKERSPLSQLKKLLHLRNHISHLLSSFRPQQNWIGIYFPFTVNPHSFHHHLSSSWDSWIQYLHVAWNPVLEVPLVPAPTASPQLQAIPFLFHALPIIMYLIPLDSQSTACWIKFWNRRWFGVVKHTMIKTKASVP